jgi:hypothetical protein
VAKAVLEHLWPDATVAHHDDGTASGMYDLRVAGPFHGAAEVGEVTDPVIREAHGHWDRHLRGRTTVALQRRWNFVFNQQVTGDAEPSNYPHQPPPAPHRIEAALANLEARHVTSLERLEPYLQPSREGWRWTDPDIGELSEQVGAAADGASSYLPPEGEPAGWGFFISRHHSSHPDPDALRRDVEERLNGDALGDLRRKLTTGVSSRFPRTRWPCRPRSRPLWSQD